MLWYCVTQCVQKLLGDLEEFAFKGCPLPLSYDTLTDGDSKEVFILCKWLFNINTIEGWCWIIEQFTASTPVAYILRQTGYHSGRTKVRRHWVVIGTHCYSQQEEVS